MSYWAATVITSIIQSVPFFGSIFYKYIVGGFSVTNTTLIRVFSAHICLAFVILGVSLIHLYYLHKKGSKNPLCLTSTYSDVVFFHSSFTVKDFFVLVLLSSVVCFFILINPDIFMDVEGFIEADPMVTPASIKPEWYFLPYYAILRSVQSKLGGIVFALIFIFLL